MDADWALPGEHARSDLWVMLHHAEVSLSLGPCPGQGSEHSGWAGDLLEVTAKSADLSAKGFCPPYPCVSLPPASPGPEGKPVLTWSVEQVTWAGLCFRAESRQAGCRGVGQALQRHSDPR